jgi:hypothetical protein
VFTPAIIGEAINAGLIHYKLIIHKTCCLALFGIIVEISDKSVDERLTYSFMKITEDSLHY